MASHPPPHGSRQQYRRNFTQYQSHHRFHPQKKNQDQIQIQNKIKTNAEQINTIRRENKTNTSSPVRKPPNDFPPIFPFSTQFAFASYDKTEVQCYTFSIFRFRTKTHKNRTKPKQNQHCSPLCLSRRWCKTLADGVALLLSFVHSKVAPPPQHETHHPPCCNRATLASIDRMGGPLPALDPQGPFPPVEGALLPSIPSHLIAAAAAAAAVHSIS